MSNANISLKVKANDFIFPVDTADALQLDLVKISDTEYHLLKDNQSYRLLIDSTDAWGKKIKMEVDGEIFDIEIKDVLDQMLEHMGFNSLSGKHIKEIKAPMPGLVLNIAVAEGDAVKEGDKLLILEAMKMENSISIPADATIKKIKVTAGQAVEKGQVLIELE